MQCTMGLSPFNKCIIEICPFDQVPRVTYHILSYSNILNSLVRAAFKYVGLVDQAVRGNVSSLIGLRPTCALGGSLVYGRLSKK